MLCIGQKDASKFKEGIDCTSISDAFAIALTTSQRVAHGLDKTAYFKESLLNFFFSCRELPRKVDQTDVILTQYLVIMTDVFYLVSLRDKDARSSEGTAFQRKMATHSPKC